MHWSSHRMVLLQVSQVIRARHRIIVAHIGGNEVICSQCLERRIRSASHVGPAQLQQDPLQLVMPGFNVLRDCGGRDHLCQPQQLSSTARCNCARLMCAGCCTRQLLGLQREYGHNSASQLPRSSLQSCCICPRLMLERPGTVGAEMTCSASTAQFHSKGLFICFHLHAQYLEAGSRLETMQMAVARVPSCSIESSLSSVQHCSCNSGLMTLSHACPRHSMSQLNHWKQHIAMLSQPGVGVCQLSR